MEAKEFIINVGPNGTFRPSGSYQTLPEHIDSIFARFEKDKIENISIYFHGGLVDEKRGMDTAFKMANHIKEAGNYPLCFVWETGLAETLSENISKISSTTLFGKLLNILIKIVSAKLGFDLSAGRGEGQYLTDEQVENELLQEHPFQSYNQLKLAGSGRGTQILTSIPGDETIFKTELEADIMLLVENDSGMQDAISETEEIIGSSGKSDLSRGLISTALILKHTAAIAFSVIKRFINKRDHDFYPTIIEEILRELYIAEIGAWVWNNMKLKAANMWNDNNNPSTLNCFAGRYLLDKLIDYRKKNNEAKINLIGHSAGSIAICNLLGATSRVYPNLVYDKIVFLAPACRTDLFNKELVSKTERFNKFRMYTMDDQYEKCDRCVPYFYTHSLLYLVSGILEGEGKEPDSYILGLARHLKGISPYDTAEELVCTNKFLFEDKSNRIVFSQSLPDAPEGFQSMSLTHSGFDDDTETINSVKYFLKEG